MSVEPKLKTEERRISFTMSVEPKLKTEERRRSFTMSVVVETEDGGT